nr:DUF1016 family protein [Bacilli bacterium]
MNYYELIKNELINNEVYSKVKDYSKNKHNLETRYNVGKLLYDAGKHYGEGIIKQYSIKLTIELGKGYDVTSLKRTRQFYMSIQKGAQFAHQLTWSHWIELISIKNINEINYYIEKTISLNLSRDKLRERIKSNEYERLPKDTKLKLSNNETTTLPDNIPNPIIINNPNNVDIVKEKALQMLIMEDIPSFLEQLGTGFTFIKNEYPIKLGDRYNYIDLLLFNIEYNCYIVIELKLNELRKQDIGQVQVYMNYIDINLKKINHNKTIGIILCRKNNEFIIEYTSDKRILSREYIVN